MMGIVISYRSVHTSCHEMQHFKVFLAGVAQMIVYNDFPECFGRIICCVNVNQIHLP